MRRLLGFLFVLGLVIAAGRIAGTAAQPSAGCAGQWLLHITFTGRDATDEAIAVFTANGDATLHSPPVVPALPEMGEEPLFVSDGIGTWSEVGKDGCAFEVVRLLAAEDGIGLGSVFLRGEATIDEGGLGIEGTFTYDQSTGLGKTVASGTGTLIGTSISP